MNGTPKPSTVKQLHNQAMEAAERAIQADKDGDKATSKRQYLIAYELERRAVEFLIPTSREPTRSILLRSAATLAMDSGLHREAERLIAIALAGEPPNELAEELRDLFERVNFERHLSTRGIQLQAGEIQLSMTGEDVSFGMIPSDLAIERVQDTQALLIRTAERKTGMVYRKGGRPSSNILDMFNVYLSTPRAASFAVTLRLGSSPELFGRQDDIISEVIECVRLVNDNRTDALREKITDEYYFDNFVGLSRKIAPDGKKIKMVGFTANSEGTEKRAMLTTPKRDIRVERNHNIKFDDSNTKLQEVTGKLGYADSFRRDNIVKIKSVDIAKTWTVYVPEGLIDDVVVPYRDKLVRIEGRMDEETGIITLNSISPLE